MHVFPGGRVDAADADPAPGGAVGPVGRRRRPSGSAGTSSRPRRWPRTSRRSARRSRRSACCWRTVDPGADLVGARSRLLADPGAFPAIADALDLRLRTDLLVPLSRWVTPPSMPRRFDARFFAAAFPEGAAVTLVGDEVLGAGLAPADRRARVDGGGRPRHVVADLDHAHAAGAREFDRGHRGATGARSARRGRGRGRGRRRDPDRDAGRWRRRRPARQRVPGRSGRVRARGSGRPDRARRWIGRSRWPPSVAGGSWPSR